MLANLRAHHEYPGSFIVSARMAALRICMDDADRMPDVQYSMLELDSRQQRKSVISFARLTTLRFCLNDTLAQIGPAASFGGSMLHDIAQTHLWTLFLAFIMLGCYLRWFWLCKSLRQKSDGALTSPPTALKGRHFSMPGAGAVASYPSDQRSIQAAVKSLSKQVNDLGDAEAAADLASDLSEFVEQLLNAVPNWHEGGDFSDCDTALDTHAGPVILEEEAEVSTHAGHLRDEHGNSSGKKMTIQPAKETKRKTE